MEKFFKHSAIYFTVIYLITILVPYAFKNAQSAQIKEPVSSEIHTINYNIGDEFKICDISTNQITTVSEKDFLVGSLIAEMLSNVPIEAMKAQTVASHSYYSYIRLQNKDKPYHISYDKENGSVYVDPNSIDKETLSIYTKAVESVYGEVLKYNSSIAYCSFFDTSNGQTESAMELWGKDLPYLVSVASPYDSMAQSIQKNYTYTPDEIKNIMQENWSNARYDFELPKEKWFSEIQRTFGNSVVSINICGFSITGEELRRTFNLSSPCFDVEFDGNVFVFTSQGQGSLVGMSQVGAVYMASEGADYKEILNWYYPNTVLSAIET